MSVTASACTSSLKGIAPLSASASPAARGLASRGLALALVALLRAYQIVVSPLLVELFGAQCRFYPSCSSYAVGAIRAVGPYRGTRAAVARVGRCHPFHPGGFDPPPQGP